MLTALAFLVAVGRAVSGSPVTTAPVIAVDSVRADSAFNVVDLVPSGGALPAQLADAAQRAAKGHQVPIVEFTSPSCEPCRMLATHLDDSAVVAELRGIYLIRLTAEDWADRLDGTNLPAPDALPSFYALDSTGKATGIHMVGATIATMPAEFQAISQDSINALLKGPVGGLLIARGTAKAIKTTFASAMRTPPASATVNAIASFDSLTLDKAKQVAAITAKLDSIKPAQTGAKQYSSFGQESEEELKEVENSPGEVALVQAGGLTPKVYVDRKSRVEMAWVMLAIRRQAPQVASLITPQPDPADVAFVSAHAAELKAMGFRLEEPKIQMGGPGGSD